MGNGFDQPEIQFGRDTGRLSEEEVVRATVETVAESASDGIVAPLFYLVLGGALSPASREGNAPLAGLFRELLMSNDPVCYAAQCQALLDGSSKGDQPKIKCPTLVITTEVSWRKSTARR